MPIQKHPKFWEILRDLANMEAPKVIANRYNLKTDTVHYYGQRFINWTASIKEDLVDPNQLRFPFIHNRKGRDFNPSRESSFFTKWKQ